MSGSGRLKRVSLTAQQTFIITSDVDEVLLAQRG
jgi:hypothetical protein